MGGGLEDDSWCDQPEDAPRFGCRMTRPVASCHQAAGPACWWVLKVSKKALSSPGNCKTAWKREQDASDQLWVWQSTSCMSQRLC